MKQLMIVFFSSFFIGLYAMEVEKSEEINQEINIDDALVAYGSLRWDGDALKESDHDFASYQKLPKFLVDYIFEYVYPDHELKQLESYAHIPKIQAITANARYAKFDSTGNFLALDLGKGNFEEYRRNGDGFEKYSKRSEQENVSIGNSCIGFDAQDNCIVGTVCARNGLMELCSLPKDDENNQKQVFSKQNIEIVEGNPIAQNKIVLAKGIKKNEIYIYASDNGGNYEKKQKLPYTPEGKEYTSVEVLSFDPRGKNLALGLNIGQVYVSYYNEECGKNLPWKQLDAVDAQKGRIQKLVFDHTGKKLAVIQGYTNLNGGLYDVEGDTEVQNFRNDFLGKCLLKHVAFSTGDKYVALTIFGKKVHDHYPQYMTFIGGKNKNGKYDIDFKSDAPREPYQVFNFSSQNLLAVGDACGHAHIYDANNLLRLKKLKNIKNTSLKRALFWKLSQRLEHAKDRFDIDAATGKIKIIKDAV